MTSAASPGVGTAPQPVPPQAITPPMSRERAEAIAAAFDLRRLPPDFLANPYPVYAALRAREPVRAMPDGSWFLTRHADLVAVYRDAATFSSDKHVEFAPKYGAGSPLYEHHTTSLVFNDPPLHTRVRKLIMGALTRRAIADLELRMARGGARTFYELSIDDFHQGERTLYSAVLRDISDRKHVELQLQRERDLAQVTLASIGDGVITTDEAGLIQYLNPVAARLTGWPAHQARGQPVTTVYRLLDETGGEPLPNPVREVLQGKTPAPRREHALLQRRDGERIPVLDTAAPIRSRDGFLIGAVLVFHDVTVTLNLARELSHQATHDALTGVPNRREFERRLTELLSRPDQARHVLCYLDLDQFKVLTSSPA